MPEVKAARMATSTWRKHGHSEACADSILRELPASSKHFIHAVERVKQTVLTRYSGATFGFSNNPAGTHKTNPDGGMKESQCPIVSFRKVRCNRSSKKNEVSCF